MNREIAGELATLKVTSVDAGLLPADGLLVFGLIFWTLIMASFFWRSSRRTL